MTESVEKETRIECVRDLNTATVKAVEEIVNDGQISAQERLKALNLGSRTVAMNNKSTIDQMRAAQLHGIKPNEAVKGLTFLSS